MRVALASLALLLAWACSKPIAPQRPDLSFWFRCEQRATPELEHRIEAFLQQQGFRVLNLGALQRTANVAIFDLNITAIDAQTRTILIYAFKESPGSQTIALFSPPPTQHDAVLEDSLLTFATQGLGCKTDQVARNTNGPEAADMHNSEVRRIEGLFKEAAELKK
jgi:hypothetical protein